jgi:hypothetical protein
MLSIKVAEVRMTLRVSRDSGRTWGPPAEVRVGDNPLPPDTAGGFSPCACTRCAEQNSADSLRMVS